MSITVLDPYTKAIANLPPQSFLGSLVFFTISNADVEIETARNGIVAHSLALDGLRKALRPMDAFAKAARDCAHKFDQDGDVEAEILVRPFGSDAETMRRVLTLERFEFNKTGQKKRRISYDKVAELILHRGERTKGVYVGHSVEALVTDGLDLSRDEAAWLSETLDIFPHRYHHHLTHLDSHAIRTFVRGYIDHLDGVCVKESGGMYFIKQEHAAEVNRLTSWVKSIGSQFHPIPLLNLTDQRAMILQAFEEEAVKEVERLMGEVAKILKNPDRRIEEATFDAYGARAAELKVKLAEYSAMLGSRAERAELQIDIFARQIMQLVGRIAA